MPAIAVRNLPDNVHRALKAQAKMHGISAEAEARRILSQALLPDRNEGFGDWLAAIGQELGGVDINFERSRETYRPLSLE